MYNNKYFSDTGMLILFNYLFMYFYFWSRCLHRCVLFFSRCGQWWLLFAAVSGLIVVVASCCGLGALELELQ